MDTKDYSLSCGRIKNFFTPSLIETFIKTFKKVNTTNGSGNDCYGIDKNHIAYPWLKKQLFNPIVEQINPHMKLIFAMYLDTVVPFGIHNDLKAIPDPAGQHFLSFLIPCSVDNKFELCHLASTLIFDETSPVNLPNQYSIKKELEWSIGDLLWWDSKLYHVSSDFVGYTSKQGIIIHTYVL
jgi:hypothetical protein